MQTSMGSTNAGTGGPFYGKYRAVVTDNVDPEQRGRLRAEVPDVNPGESSSWAMPCIPVAGDNMGLFTVPPVGSGVWIEFERGDPDYPIWVGGYWGSAREIPSMAQAVTPGVAAITLQSPQGNGITVSDMPGANGGILIQTANGARISVSSLGIVIDNGGGVSIKLSATSVDVNDGGLNVLSSRT